MNSSLIAAFCAVVSISAAAQGKSGLDNPSVPVAPANAPQSAGAVLEIPGATDVAPEGSPVAARRVGATLRVGSGISVRLANSVDSGSVKNGDAVHGSLTAAVRTTAGVTLPAGTRVDGTVVSAAKAGTVQSGGILSLQLTRVGAVPVVTDVIDFNGQEGHKDVADSAPQKGSEAIAQAGATLQFKVMENGRVPGVIPGARLDNAGGGGGTGNKSGGQPSTGQPNTGPGVNQVPINGGSQPAQPAAPSTGPGR